MRSLCHHGRLVVNPTSTYKARPLLSKTQSRSWDAGSPPHQVVMPRSLKTSPKHTEHSLPMEVLAHTCTGDLNKGTVEDFTYILTRVHIHPSLMYAINVAIQGSWLKLWGTALDYGAGGTHHAQAILRALTTPLFGDRLYPAPWCTYPVIENTSTLLDQIKRGHSLQAKIGLWHHPYSARSFCARPSNMQAAGRAR